MHCISIATSNQYFSLLSIIPPNEQGQVSNKEKKHTNKDHTNYRVIDVLIHTVTPLSIERATKSTTWSND